MARIIEKTAKTVEDALEAALNELGLDKNNVEYQIIEEPSNGFFGIIGKKMAKIQVIVKESAETNNNNEHNDEKMTLINKKKDITNDDEEAIITSNKLEDNANESISKIDNFSENKINIAKKFLKNMLNAMNLEVKIETQDKDDEYIFNLYGENLGILIGKHGQTLDAIQYIINLAANKNESINRIRFIVDVENYRSRRKEILQNLAKNLAERAIKMNQDIRLEPMNRHERKIIHSSLQDNLKVTTNSIGEEPRRYVIISPRKNNKHKNHNHTNK